MKEHPVRVRQSDIAQALNISRTTVARALNGSGYVDEETRRMIFELSESMKYRKNLFASSLAAKNKLKVHCAYVRTYNKTFVQDLEAGFKAAVQQFSSYGIDFHFSSVTSMEPLEQLSMLGDMKSLPMDAFIVMPLLVDEVRPLIKAIADQDVPVITLNMDVPGSGRYTFVGSDNYSGGRMAAELYARMLDGKGRILVFTSCYHYAMPEDRYRGFLDKMAEYPGIRLTEPHEVDAFEEMYELTRDYLDRNELLDGIYTVTDSSYVAKAVSDWCAEHGQTRDIRLVAMDNDAEARDYLRSGRVHAIVAQRPFIQAYIAVKLAVEKLLHKDGARGAAPRIEYDIVVKENLSTFDNADYFETIFRSL
jgi:LacI family transcriptional regulator